MQRTYINLLTFATLNLWDVKRYKSQDHFEFDYTVRLGDILNPYNRPVSKDEMIENKWKIISKINFAGELFLREFDEINSYKGNLNLVPDNAIIFSKINVRHGCIYFHKKNEIPFGVSSEYPTFQFDDSKVNGEFLQKLLRTTNFKELLNSKATGISKSRVKKEEFLDIEIPLPSLEEQGRIINAYKEKVERAKELEREAEELEKEIEDYLYGELGVSIQNKSENNRGLNLHFINYREIERWALSHISKNQIYSFKKVKYGIKPIKSILKSFDGGKTPSTSKKEYWGGNINWFSAKDMKTLQLENSEDLITSYALKNAGMKLHQKGTILGVFRSGILRHSFPVAILEEPATINQDLKAMNFDSSLIINKYALYYLHVFQKIVLEQAQKVGVTVESINTKEFLEIPVVLPSMDIQKDIVKTIDNLKTKIQDLKNKSELYLIQANQEFENEIFNN